MSKRFLCGLVGEDIQASRSPWIHEHEADSLGVRLTYSLYDLAATGDRDSGLKPLLGAAARMGFAGLNVTHPYKQRILPLLDDLSPEVRQIGAANTVHFVNGRTVGHNTDFLGFAEGLRRGLPDGRFGKVVQLGAGGAGSATANALLEHGVEQLLIYEVDPARSEALRANLSRTFEEERVGLVDDIGAAVASADGVVNATPIGMVGHAGVPLPLKLIRPDLWVADIIYFPLETELLRYARQLGCRTVDGVTMVVFQAAAAFDIFTGLNADRERMLAAALQNWRS